MDLSFIRRNRPVAIDLPALLARTAAAQSASPTARAQVRLETVAGHFHPIDPHVVLFAQGPTASAFVGRIASFADLSGDIFSPRQPN
ncbi:hypothetical protein [Sphingomonas sp. SUN039]|uniref:hypothetical protein n=1 Tax=Sphingomonas sp. SUN039 TaxID=2937787 RepID=UPI0021646658|nr:hypothetical protein [Sphingomonas sp. SUN039]UVO55613.1 hypothetical protein M0209_16370 [Sphingomonas sp. SUN039]